MRFHKSNPCWWILAAIVVHSCKARSNQQILLSGSKNFELCQDLHEGDHSLKVNLTVSLEETEIKGKVEYNSS